MERSQKTPTILYLPPLTDAQSQAQQGKLRTEHSTLCALALQEDLSRMHDHVGITGPVGELMVVATMPDRGSTPTCTCQGPESSSMTRIIPTRPFTRKL